jgi:glutathione S-transferase
MDSACFGNGGDMAAPVWRGKWRSDWALEGRAYLGGDELTLADIAIGPWIYRLFELGFAEETSVCLADWYRRLSDRSPYRDHVMIGLA